MIIVIYRKSDGIIINTLGSDQNVDLFLQHRPQKEKINLSHIIIDKKNILGSLSDYKIVNKKLIKMTNEEIEDISEFGRILTKEEHLLNKLSPSPDEIQKALNTIEILTLLQEVM